MFNIGNRVISLRHLHNISANKLSKDLGVDPSTINKIEKGTAKPSMDLLFNICNYFDISLSEFFAEEKPFLLPEQQRLLKATENLSPKQIEILMQLIAELKSYNKQE